jgi:hypothetical protein
VNAVSSNIVSISRTRVTFQVVNGAGRAALQVAQSNVATGGVDLISPLVMRAAVGTAAFFAARPAGENRQSTATSVEDDTKIRAYRYMSEYEYEYLVEGNGGGIVGVDTPGGKTVFAVAGWYSGTEAVTKLSLVKLSSDNRPAKYRLDLDLFWKADELEMGKAIPKRDALGRLLEGNGGIYSTWRTINYKDVRRNHHFEPIEP